mgnify:CR=1 FL=1
MRKGQSLIEVFIAMGVGILMLSGITTAFSLTLRSNEHAEKSRNAAILSDALMESARSFADGNWPGLYGLPHGSGNKHHFLNSGGTLAAQSGIETVNLNTFDYTRSFYAENVSRDINGDIESVYNPNNEDPSTQKITVETDYVIFGAARNLTVYFYVTRMRNFIFMQTDWSGGDGQDGPIMIADDEFSSETNVDYSTVPGSIMPVADHEVDIYVADLDNDRIQRFDENGDFIVKWGAQGSDPGEFKKPYSVAIDSLNNVYVVDKDNDRIQKFNSSGDFLATWGSSGSGDGQFGHPQGIAVDSENNIYVVDLDRDRIQKFNSSGDFLLKWGTNGNGNGQFNKPQDVTVDSEDDVYVTDQDNNRVQKFDSAGNFLLKWGTNGNGNGQFMKPVGIGTDSGDNVYVADRDNDRIQKFNSAGTFVRKWGSAGSDAGEFQKPQGVTADQYDFVYVADSNNHRIQKFDSDGNFVLEWGDSGSADGEFNHPRGMEYIPAVCTGECSLISSIFDTQLAGGASLNTVMWQGTYPAGTSVKFQFASSNNSAGPWNFTGPGGSSATFYSPSSTNYQKAIDYTEHYGRRYFRYKIFFEISGSSVPRMDDIILGFSR